MCLNDKVLPQILERITYNIFLSGIVFTKSVRLGSYDLEHLPIRF